MNTERIKSLVLFLLVTTSFVLTTRIWFNISIEGLFVMPQIKKAPEVELAYNKADLLKPNQLVVHVGPNHTLLFNNTTDKEYYTLVLNGAKDVLRDWLVNHENYSSSSQPIDKLEEIRNGKAVELIFKNSIEYENIKGLLNADKNPWNDIKDISSIIINPYRGRLSIVDVGKGKIFDFRSSQMPGTLKGTIDGIEKRNDFDYVFLNEYNIDYESYGGFAVVPVSVATMPALKAANEIAADTEPSPEIVSFFNDDDENKNIISLKNDDGGVSFTDREEATVTIDNKGALEYYKYNVASDNVNNIDIKEAIDIATQFVNDHLKFTYDFYLSGVESGNQGGLTSYIISYDYKYNGFPIITEMDTGDSAIEVEILGGEVKKYKRNVRVIEDQNKSINIKSFDEILDMVWGGLNKDLNATKSQSIVMVNDMYLAYFDFQRNDALIPIWVVYLKIEGEDQKSYNKKYIIDAEKGTIWGEK